MTTKVPKKKSQQQKNFANAARKSNLASGKTKAKPRKK